MTRRPSALLPAPYARLAGYALLATLGSLQWVRFVDGASMVRAIAWALAGTVTGALVLLARRRPLPLAGAVLFGAALALAASGLDLRYLEPKHLDELGDGLGRGIDALNTVRLPYLGKEPWVLTTVQLSGAAFCWAAALLTAWPTENRPPARIGALLLLLTMAASPIVSIGTTRPALLGIALAVLTAAFLWLERLARRPGVGAIVLAAAVLLAAVPLGAAADREEPWFDYKAFSEKLSGGTPITYSWDHDYGPIDWPRDGVELFRVKSDRPYYWKADVLSRFVDDRWQDGSASTGVNEELPEGGGHDEWLTTFSVALRRLRTDTVVGAGTVLDVTDSSRPVEPDFIPGLWSTEGDRDLSKGDSYRVRSYVPRPTGEQLAAATVGRDPDHAQALRVQVGIRPGKQGETPSIAAPVSGDALHPNAAAIQFAPFESGRAPAADYVQFGLTGSGRKALAISTYPRTWRLASRLRRAAGSPYDYLLRVNDYLRSDGFVYSEVPPKPKPGVPALESFLFDSKRGYCQQFSGSMALLLRMGGVPARVVTGFSPGGFRASSGEWVVRDTDAHSWVEAWFDGLGWVTFDPTPPETPARSQVAAIKPDAAGGFGATTGQDSGSARLRNRQPGGAQRDTPVASRGGGGSSDDGSPWPWLGLGALLAAAIAAGAFVISNRGGSDPLVELERALRRSGRAVPTGVTLTELERRLGTSGYLHALRTARYRDDASGTAGPTSEQRAAFRRELAAGLGWSGWLRAYYALPPRRRP